MFIKTFNRYISRTTIQTIIKEYLKDTPVISSVPKKRGCPFKVNTEQIISKVKDALRELMGGPVLSHFQVRNFT